MHLKRLQMHVRDGTGSQQRRFNFHHLLLSKEAPDPASTGHVTSGCPARVMLPFNHGKSTLKTDGDLFADAILILTRAGVDAQHIAHIDEQRHLDHRAQLKVAGLVPPWLCRL